MTHEAWITHGDVSSKLLGSGTYMSCRSMCANYACTSQQTSDSTLEASSFKEQGRRRNYMLHVTYFFDHYCSTLHTPWHSHDIHSITIDIEIHSHVVCLNQRHVFHVWSVCGHVNAVIYGQTCRVRLVLTIAKAHLELWPQSLVLPHGSVQT